MANIALLHGKNMINVFAARELAVVATAALRRQPLEYGVDVARLAAQMGVQANQRETGGKVVEVFVQGLRIRGIRSDNSQQCE